MIGELLPDQPDRDNPGLLQAKNVYPYARAYRQVRAFLADTNALGNTCLGANVLRNSANVIYNYAGDDNDVYTRSADTWSAIAGSGSFNAARWEFNRYYDTVIAVNGGDEVLTGTFGGALSAVTNGPDTPKCLTVARGHTIVANYTAGGAYLSDAAGVAWSALGAPTNWETGESGSQHLDLVGSVTKLIGGEYVTVVCNDGIFRMNYLGASPWWGFDHVEGARGCLQQGMVANVGHYVYYLAPDGFYVFDGNKSIPISSDKLTQTFYDDFDSDSGDLCSAIADTENNYIIFAYPGTGHSGVANRQYIYNYVDNVWSGPIEREVQFLTYTQEPAVTADSLNTAPDDYVDSVALAGIYVDAPAYLGGDKPTVSAFIPGNKHAIQAGTVLSALLETGEYAFNEGGYAFVQGFRPIIDGATAGITGAVDYRNTTGGTITRNSLTAPSTRSGVIDQRVNARYHRFRLQMTGEFESISGGAPVLPGGSR